MAFVKKVWQDRAVEFAGRRRLKNVLTEEETVYDVTRNEGTILKEGDKFSAENMNGLEDRIEKAINELNDNVQAMTQAQYNAMGSGRPQKLYVIVG